MPFFVFREGLMRRIVFCLILIVFCAVFVKAQVDHDDNALWNDFQITVPMDKHFDFFLSGTLRFGKNITRVQETRVGVGFVFKPLKDLSFSPSFLSITARNSSGRFRRENRLSFYVRYRFPIKEFGLIHRSMVEWRIRRPRESWRYRPSLTFEKDIPKDFFIKKAKFFVTEEVFYDSGLGKWSRNRFSIGITKTLNKKTSVDIYYLRQNDGFSIPGDLNVIGTAWKIKL
jgi:hypothetical protein